MLTCPGPSPPNDQFKLQKLDKSECVTPLFRASQGLLSPGLDAGLFRWLTRSPVPPLSQIILTPSLKDGSHFFWMSSPSPSSHCYLHPWHCFSLCVCLPAQRRDFLGTGTLSYQYLSIAYCFTQCLALEEMGTRKNKLDEMG